MADQNVTLRIRTDASGSVTAIQSVTGEVNKVAGASTRAGRDSQRGFDQIGRSASTAGETVRGLRTQVLGFFGIAAGAVAVRTIARLADEYTNLQSRIRLVTDSQQQANAVGDQVFAIAQRTRSELSATGQLYTTLARSTADLRLSQQQLAQITETVNQSFIVSGASAESSRAAIVQLSQGLASGALRGDEFNSVAEQAPILLDLLAKSLGKSRGELRAFAAEGGITAKILTDSLLAGSTDVQQQFDGMAVTISGASTQIGNAFTRFIGQSASATGASTALASALSLVATNFDLIASAALTVSAVILSRYVTAMASAAAVSLRTSLAARSIAKEFVTASVASNTFAVAGRSLFALIGGWPVLIAGAAIGLGVLINRLATAQARAEEIAKTARGQALEINRRIVEANQSTRQSNPNLILSDIAQTERSLRQLEQRFSANSVPVKTLRDRLSELNDELGRSKAAADAADPTLVGQRKAIDELIKATAAQVQGMREQIAGVKGGAAAVLKLQLEQFSAADATAEQKKQIADLIAILPGLEAQLKAVKDEQKSGNRESERAAELAKSFRAETASLAAELSGPTAQAWLEYESAIQDAAELIKAGSISIDEFNARSRLQEEQLKRTNAEIARQRAPIQQMLDDLEFEAELIGLSNTQREIAIALRQIEADAQENGRTLTEAEIEAKKQQIRLQIEANAAQQATVDAAQQAADDYQQAWEGATTNITRAFGDFVANGASKFRSLGRDLKNIAKDFLSDLVSTFLRNSLTLRVTTAAGGAGASGNSFANSLSGLFGQGGGGSSLFGSLFGGGGGSSPFNGSGPLASFAGQGTGTSQGGFGGFFSSLFSQGGSSGGTSSGGFGGASAAGAIGGGLFGSLIGGKAGATGGTIGGSIGGNFGPWGAAIGAVIGSVAGTIIGNKFQTVLSGAQLSIGAAGAVGFQFENQKKKGGLFGSNKKRTLETDLSAEAQQAIDDLFNAVSNSVATSAAALGIDTPAIIAGSFRREFDKKGNLKREFSTIAGRIVEETQDQFALRLQALNIIGVIDKALGNTEATSVSQQFAGNAQKLLDGAQFLLGATVDLRNGFNLLGDGTLAEITAFTVELAQAGEPLVNAYARLVAGSALLDEALKLSNVSLDLSREQFVRFSSEIVDAAGGLDRATSLWQGYFQRFFSDNERAANSLNAAQLAAQTQFGDIGLNASDFASAEGLAQFRALFEAALPTLAADAVVQWLEAAQAIGVVIDAQDALNRTLSTSEQAINQFSDDLAALMDGVRDQSRVAADALADFGLAPLAAGLQQVAREMERTIVEAQRLGATESDLSEIRALGAAQAELLQRQAAAELTDLLAGVNTALLELDASPIEIELARITAAMSETLAQASALGASEEQLAQIRALGVRQSSNVIEAEVQRLRDVFADLARAIGDARSSISSDILNIQRTQPGFSESAFQSGNISSLREQLAGAADPQAQIGLIDQIRQATVARYNAELANIQQTAQAQDQAAQAAQQAVNAQREALNRLRDFADGLGLSSNSPLTAFQRLDVARSQFDATLGRARGGDADAISGLQQAAEALLSENRNVFGVSNTAVAEFERVQSALRSVAGQGVRGAAASFSGFERASIDVNSQIAALQANAISELQGLDDTLAALAITTEADTEGTIQALRDRFDQAETHTNKIIDHIQPIFDAITRQNETGDAQVAQLQQQTAQLAEITTELQNGADINGAFLDKFLVYAQQQETTMTALVERLGRAIERSADAKVRA